MRVRDIAKAQGDKDPADTVLALMAAENGRITGVFHNQSEKDLQIAMKRPDFRGKRWHGLDRRRSRCAHPRNFGTHARVLGRYVRELNVLTLEDAVRKMTSLPAQILGLRDRGLIREGYAADIVVFDKATAGDTNSFEKPKGYATGIPYVLVNGVVVIDKGQHTGAKPAELCSAPSNAREQVTHSSSLVVDAIEIRSGWTEASHQTPRVPPGLTFLGGALNRGGERETVFVNGLSSGICLLRFVAGDRLIVSAAIGQPHDVAPRLRH